MSKKIAIVLVLAGFLMGTVLTVGIGASAKKGKVSLKKVYKSARVATKRIVELKGLINKLNAKVAGVDSNVSNVGGKVDGLNGKVDGVRSVVDGNRSRINSVFSEVGKNRTETMETNDNAYEGAWNAYVVCYYDMEDMFGEGVGDEMCYNPNEKYGDGSGLQSASQSENDRKAKLEKFEELKK